MEAGKGYWILIDEARTYSITGSIIDERNLTVQDGWYMIGGCSLQAKASVDSGNIKVIYDYKQGFGYHRVLGSDHIEAGIGYWILFRIL